MPTCALGVVLKLKEVIRPRTSLQKISLIKGGMFYDQNHTDFSTTFSGATVQNHTAATNVQTWTLHEFVFLSLGLL